MKWTRPITVPVGQIWSRFKGREIDGKPAKMYQIRDMEESIKGQCLNLMQESFLKYEPLCIALGLDSNNDPESLETIRSNWKNMMDQGVCVACFTELDGQPDKLIAFNVLYVATKDDEPPDFNKIKGEKWKMLLKTLMTAEKLVDVFSKYGVDAYLSSSGLTVLPECRGQNIGARIMEAREPICKALGIHATCTVFTAITSQVLATKAGFQLLAELPYSDMMEHGIDLSNCTCPTAKVMGTRYNF